MKVIELMEVLSKLDPEYQITFNRENPITPKIWYRTDLTRVSEYAYWLGNRMEELTIIPAKDSLLRFKSRKKEHEYQWDKFFISKLLIMFMSIVRAMVSIQANGKWLSISLTPVILIVWPSGTSIWITTVIESDACNMIREWNAVKWIMISFLAACTLFAYFTVGIIVGRSILVDRSAPTKVAIYISWSK